MNSTLNIYKASAGSGKTFTLTIEYIYLMVRPQADEEYMHTLAVTFTNKATAEMKDRILQHLYGIWKELPSSQDYVKKILEKLRKDGCDMTEEQLRQHSGKALTMILHDYSRFRVETIDSFFQSVLRTLARELGQSSNLQVDLNDMDILELAVDRMIDSLDLDSTLRKIVVQYVTDELDENGRWKIQSAIKDFAKCIFQEDFLQRTTNEREKISDATKVREFRKKMKELMDEAEAEIIEKAKKIATKVQALCTPDLVGKVTPPPLTYLMHTINGNDKEKEATAKGKKFCAFLEDGTSLLLKKQKNNSVACAELQDLSNEFSDYLKDEDSIKRRYNTAKLARHFTNQLQLLSRIDEIVRDINEERETFPLSRTPTLLSRLIDGQDNPFVFEKIGTILRNIMIDEFQDTSRLQWNNFRVLLFENQSLGGTDLIVGDIKQSIYRWRGGEWSLLSDLSENMKTWNPQTETLDTNYRSEHRIIDFNNNLFPQAASLLDNIAPHARFKIGGKDGIYSDVIQKTSPHKAKDQKGFWSATLRIKGNQTNGQPKLTSEEENEWMMESMLNEICNLYDSGLPLNKMAILLRTNKHAPMILDYFQQRAPEHIRIASDEAYLLGNSSMVTIIIAAMRILTEDYEEKPIAFHHFLMHYLLRVEKQEISMDEIMRCNAMDFLPPVLVEERERLKQMPLYELVEELYRKLQLDRLCGQEAYHYAFLDAVQLYLRDNPNDIHSFLEVWDTKLYNQAIPSGKQEGIRILTIHKSKGLEFHTVLLPFCDWAMERDKGDTLWCDAEEHGDVFNILGRMPISKTSTMSKSYYSARYEEEHLQSRVDELNSLYVAFTRASCNMYIWGICTDKGLDGTNSTVGNLLAVCLNPHGEYDNGIWHMQEGEPITSVKAEKASDNRMQPDFTPTPVRMTSYKARLNFRQSNESKEMFGDGDDARATGVLFHNVLEQIKDATQVEHILTRNRIQGRLTQEQCDELHGYLGQMERDPLIASWFSPENHVFAECDILNPNAKSKDRRDQRPDRIVMNANTITVVDYKFGDEARGYKKQVREYMNLLKQMYPSHKVKGYLWYVRNERTEEV